MMSPVIDGGNAFLVLSKKMKLIASWNRYIIDISMTVRPNETICHLTDTRSADWLEQNVVCL